MYSQAVKDWHLVLAVLVLLSVILVMVLLSIAVPPLRPDLVLIPDVERPRGRTVSHNHAVGKLILEVHN